MIFDREKTPITEKEARNRFGDKPFQALAAKGLKATEFADAEGILAAMVIRPDVEWQKGMPYPNWWDPSTESWDFV